MPADYDSIVVGVGGMGSATVAALADRGVDVLGLERFDVPHTNGSSHGGSRIIRLAYEEGAGYVPLLHRAYERWRDLDARHDGVLTTTGSVTVGPPGNEDVAAARHSLDAHDTPYDAVTGADLNARHPGHEFPADWEGVSQPDGGFLDPERAISAYVEDAFAAGATVRARESVTDWTADESGVTVTTDRDTYTADHLVFTAGAYTPTLVPALADVLQPERQVMAWFQPTHPEWFDPHDFPVFIAYTDDGEFYGFPRHDRPGVKVGKHHHFEEPTTPGDVPEPTREDEAVIHDFLAAHMPDAAGPTLSLVTCIYTNTPDRDFLIDTHPDHENVTVAAGFSGHGFKFVSVVGEILADLTLDGTTDHPIDAFRYDRFD